MLWYLVYLAVAIGAWVKSGPAAAVLVFLATFGSTLLGSYIGNRLARAWRDSPNSGRKVWAISRLAALGDIEPAIAQVGRKGRASLRAMVILQERHDPRIAEAAVQLLDSDSGLLRGWAVSQLGKYPDPRFVPLLTARLTDPDESVRKEAGKALAQFDAAAG